MCMCVYTYIYIHTHTNDQVLATHGLPNFDTVKKMYGAIRGTANPGDLQGISR